MATIKTLLLSELVIGETYFMYWGHRLYWKIIFLGVVDQFGTANLEIVVAQILRNKWKSINMPFCSEIGIGKTKAQSRANYGTFKNQTVSNAYKTRDDAQHENRKYLKPFEYKANLNDPFYM